jgi:hypothetical protein
MVSARTVPDGYVRAKDERGWSISPPLDESTIGSIVFIARRGGGISVHECGLFARVTGVGRTRLKIELLGRHPSHEGRDVLMALPTCLQVWAPDTETEVSA